MDTITTQRLTAIRELIPSLTLPNLMGEFNLSKRTNTVVVWQQ